MRWGSFGVAVGCVVATGCGGYATPSEHPRVDGARAVLTTSVSEDGPAVAAGVLAWMQSPRVNHNPPYSTTDVFVRTHGVTRRVNPAGTYAQTGGIDGRWLIVQIIQPGRSRLARYDLATRQLSFLGSAINDDAWLWRPDIDGHGILYGAIVPGTTATLAYEIRLADLKTGRVRVLARLDGHAEYAAPGQLRGNWATWVACTDNSCNVWRENLSTGVAESAVDPDHLSYTQLAPAVDRRGVVYYERALATCGDAEIRRWSAQGDSLVLRLPSRFAYQYGYLTKQASDLYFDLGGCARNATDDIYALEVAESKR
jgi:hypothetical protein